MKRQGRLLLVGTLVLAASLLGCGGADEAPQPTGRPMAGPGAGEKAQGERSNGAPVIEGLDLRPMHPKPGGTVEAVFDVHDPDGDPVRVTLAWKLNGRLIDEGSHRTKAIEGLTRGDEIEVVVTATDGRAESAPERTSVEVGNRAPIVTGLALRPADPVRPGDVVEATVNGSDPDGDELGYAYRWVVNGRETRDAGPSFDTTKLHRGDRLQVFARVKDDLDESPEAASREITLANSPPEFEPLGKLDMEGGVFRHTFVAKDPDGDGGLRYRLVKGPRGMRIDAVTGEAVWKPKAEDAGSHEIEVAVADSYGDATALKLQLEVTAAAAGTPGASQEGTQPVARTGRRGYRSAPAEAVPADQADEGF